MLSLLARYVRSEFGRVRSRTSFCWMTSNPSFRVL